MNVRSTIKYGFSVGLAKGDGVLVGWCSTCVNMVKVSGRVRLNELGTSAVGSDGEVWRAAAFNPGFRSLSPH